MKNAFLFILCVLMMACATTKKSVLSKETASLDAETIEFQSKQSAKLIDTTKTENGKITITEIEFYPPIVDKEPKVSNKDDSDNKLNPTKTNNVSGLNLQNIGSINNAAIKSIKQTTIETDTEKKGESKESSSNEHLKKEVTLANNEKVVNSETLPAPDPYKWRYIFYILLIGMAALLYFKRVPILNWIKTILSGIRKVF